MTKLRKTSLRVAGLMAVGLTLSACDTATYGVSYGYDPYYDSLLWNDYYYRPGHGGDIDRPDRPEPVPPIAKPPSKPPSAQPLPARPPIHRPSGGGGRGGGGGGRLR